MHSSNKINLRNNSDRLVFLVDDIDTMCLAIVHGQQHFHIRGLLANTQRWHCFGSSSHCATGAACTYKVGRGIKQHCQRCSMMLNQTQVGCRNVWHQMTRLVNHCHAVNALFANQLKSRQRRLVARNAVNLAKSSNLCIHHLGVRQLLQNRRKDLRRDKGQDICLRYQREELSIMVQNRNAMNVVATASIQKTRNGTRLNSRGQTSKPSRTISSHLVHRIPRISCRGIANVGYQVRGKTVVSRQELLFGNM